MGQMQPPCVRVLGLPAMLLWLPGKWRGGQRWSGGAACMLLGCLVACGCSTVQHPGRPGPGWGHGFVPTSTVHSCCQARLHHVCLQPCRRHNGQERPRGSRRQRWGRRSAIIVAAVIVKQRKRCQQRTGGGRLQLHAPPAGQAGSARQGVVLWYGGQRAGAARRARRGRRPREAEGTCADVGVPAHDLPWASDYRVEHSRPRAGCWRTCCCTGCRCCGLSCCRCSLGRSTSLYLCFCEQGHSQMLLEPLETRLERTGSKECCVLCHECVTCE